MDNPDPRSRPRRVRSQPRQGRPVCSNERIPGHPSSVGAALGEAIARAPCRMVRRGGPPLTGLGNHFGPWAIDRPVLRTLAIGHFPELTDRRLKHGGYRSRGKPTAPVARTALSAVSTTASRRARRTESLPESTRCSATRSPPVGHRIPVPESTPPRQGRGRRASRDLRLDGR